MVLVGGESQARDYNGSLFVALVFVAANNIRISAHLKCILQSSSCASAQRGWKYLTMRCFQFFHCK